MEAPNLVLKNHSGAKDTPRCPLGIDDYTLANDYHGWSGMDDADEPKQGIEPKQGSESSFRSLSAKVVTDAKFESFILALIAINGVMMGIGTTDFVTDNPHVLQAFQAVDYAFLIIFTFELVFAFGHHGLGLFRSGWLTFDFLVIMLSWAFPTLQVVRGFRCLRLLTRIESVRKIIYALQSVLPMLASIVVLLSVIFYVSAVTFTDLFKPMYRQGLTSEDYFGSLPKSLFTLFQVMTGAGWPDIAREVMKTYSWAWIPFVSFIFVTMFIVIELTIAALCKSVSNMESMGTSEGTGESERDARMSRLEDEIERLANKTGSTRNIVSKPFRASAPAILYSNPVTAWYDAFLLPVDGDEQIIVSAMSQDSEDSTKNWFQSLCGSAVRNATFQKTIVILILVNSITMGVATFDFVTENAKVEFVFNVVDYTFLVIFTFEIILQFGYRGWNCFKFGWLMYDFFSLTLSWVLPTLLMPRAFRSFRLFSRVGFLRDIIAALLFVLPNLFVIAALLLLMIYIFGVIFTDLFKSMYDDGLTSEDYFSSLDRTLFTLFQCMTIAGWPDIAREVIHTYSWAWFPFVSWIILSKFIMVQLIIAVLCQSLAHVPTNRNDTDADDNDAAAKMDRLEQKLGMLASNIDTLLLESRGN
eukprot:scaffold173032_cov38-Attheya_sp.AAC.1